MQLPIPSRIIRLDSPECSTQVCLGILSLVADNSLRGDLTLLCVGTDRSTGDSLGPLVGSMLVEWGFPGPVYGTLDDPVHAENLDDISKVLKETKGKTPILGVDACLGTKDEVGSIVIKSGPLMPGLGVRKKLKPIGDLHIAGVVNIGGFMEYMVLQNTRLSLVMKMARVIAAGIFSACSVLTAGCSGKVPGPLAPSRTTFPDRPRDVLLPPRSPQACDRRR